MKKKWGCEKDIKPFEFFGETLTRCPLRLMIDEPLGVRNILNQNRWMEKGFLPSPGTWYDQSTVFVQLMDTVEIARAEGGRYKLDKGAQREQERAEAMAAMKQDGVDNG